MSFISVARLPRVRVAHGIRKSMRYNLTKGDLGIMIGFLRTSLTPVQVNPRSDRITVDGAVLSLRPPEDVKWVVLYKPKGAVTTTNDEKGALPRALMLRKIVDNVLFSLSAIHTSFVDYYILTFIYPTVRAPSPIPRHLCPACVAMYTRRSVHSGGARARGRALSFAAGGAAGPQHRRCAAPNQRQRLVACADAPEPRF